MIIPTKDDIGRAGIPAGEKESERMDKQTLIEAAEFCEDEAGQALSRGLDFSRIGSGPRSSLADFEKAGALLSAAAELRRRAKEGA